MALHTDIPTRPELERLLTATADHCVSIYLPTHRVTQETHQDRLVLRDLTRQAVEQLEAAGADADAVADIEANLVHLAEGDDEGDDPAVKEFWPTRLRAWPSLPVRAVSKPTGCPTISPPWLRCRTASTSPRCCGR